MTTRQLAFTKSVNDRKRATRPRGQAIPIPEHQVQSAIVERLTWAGYLVLSTSRIRKGVRCQCGKFSVPQGGDGVSKGVPDLIISHADWPQGVWIGMEVKGSQTPLSAEQIALIATGRYVAVRDQDMAHTELQRLELSALGKIHGRRFDA